MLKWYLNNSRRIDPFLGGLLGVSVLFPRYISFVADAVRNLDASHRSSLYSTIASIVGSLLGFVIAAVAIVLPMASLPRLRVLRASPHYRELWRTFHSAIRWLAVATIACLVGLASDRSPDPLLPVTAFAVFTVVTAALRLLNAIWVLERVVDLVVGDGAP
jgi:uncharacterized membrane protein